MPVDDLSPVDDPGESLALSWPWCVVPDYAAALAGGSAHLGLDPPRDLDEALTFLLAMYTALGADVPSTAGRPMYPMYLGSLDTLLEPFVAGLDPAGDDALLRAALRRFWLLVGRTLPGAVVHADLGPDDGRVVRAVLRVDRELRQLVPDLTLRVDPERTPDALLREGVLTACSDGKPHFANHPMMARDVGAAYGVVGCGGALPRGGGALTLGRLNLVESVRRVSGGSATYLEEVLPRDVALAAELMVARIRFLVEKGRFFERNWLVREGLVNRERFTALVRVVGVAEAVEELLSRDGVTGPGGVPARYGRDRAASELARALVARVASLVEVTALPHCEATGGHALLAALPGTDGAGTDGAGIDGAGTDGAGIDGAGTDGDAGVTAGASVPPGQEPMLYEHLRLVAPHHRCFPGGVSDVFRFEPAVRDNPDAVVAVLRGAFAEGMRDFTFDVTGSGFVRVTGYLARERDVAALKAAAALKVEAIRAENAARAVFARSGGG